MGKDNIHGKAMKSFSKITDAALNIKAGKNIADNIHDLRVSYKKLRALLRATGIEDALPVALKDLYHKAGEMRDLQLYIDQLKTLNERKANAPVEYIANLSVKVNELHAELSQAIDNLDQKGIINSLQQRIPDSIKKKNIWSFADVKKSAAQTLHAVAKTDEEIHQIRKYLKDAIYTRELIDKKTSKKLDKATDVLGEINDINRFLALSESTPNHLSDTEQKIIKRMRKDWIDRKHDLKEKLSEIKF